MAKIGTRRKKILRTQLDIVRSKLPDQLELLQQIDEGTAKCCYITWRRYYRVDAHEVETPWGTVFFLRGRSGLRKETYGGAAFVLCPKGARAEVSALDYSLLPEKDRQHLKEIDPAWLPGHEMAPDLAAFPLFHAPFDYYPDPLIKPAFSAMAWVCLNPRAFELPSECYVINF